MSLKELYLNTLSNDFLFEIGIGRVPTHFGVLKFAESDNIGTTQGLIYDAVALGAPANIPYLADGVEQHFLVKSTSPNDVYGTGSGAHAIRIFGLKADGTWQVEDVKLNGTTNIQTVGKYWRIFRAYVIKAGSRVGLAGNITISYGGIIFAGIVYSATRQINQTNMLTFTIPKGYTAALLEAHLFAPSTKTCEFNFIGRNFEGVDRLQRSAKGVLSDSVHWDYKVPAKYDALTDLEVKALVTSPPASGVSGDFSLVLSKNNNDVPSLVGTPTIGEVS